MTKPLRLIVIGFFMILLGGIVMPFLMFFKLVPSTFFLNFSSYAVSVSGLFLGIFGSAMYVRVKRPPK